MSIDSPVDVAENVLSQHVRQFLTIFVSVASFCLAIAQVLCPEDAVAMIARNELPLSSRLVILCIPWALALLVVVGTFFFTRLRSDRERLRAQVATLVAPLVVSAFVPILFAKNAFEGRETAYLSLLMAVGLALEWLLRPCLKIVFHSKLGGMGRALRTLSDLRWIKWLPATLMTSLVLVYFFRIGHLTNVSHEKMATMSSDLAEFDNLFFNALHGHPFRSPACAAHLEDWSMLQVHAEFCLYLLLPFYALSPGAHALLWIQTGLVALTCVPLYLLAAARIGRVSALGVSFVYFMMPAVQQPNFYDFHFTAAGMMFVAWLLYFVSDRALHPGSRRASIGLYVSLFLALFSREDVSIGIAVLGLFLILAGTLVREGIILFGGAVAYFVIMKFGIMPLVGRFWFDDIYAELKAEGATGFSAVVLTLLTNQAFVVRSLLTDPKLLYVLHMLVPVLALWLRRPLLWMAIFPGFVSTLLATNRAPLYQSSFQYTYLWVPYVIAASVLAIRPGRRGWSTIAAVSLVALSLGTQMGVLVGGERILGGFSHKSFEITESDSQRLKELREIIALIPPDASVLASELEGPHVSTRLVMYSLKYSLGHNPDYILVSHPRFGAEKQHLTTALESQEYGVVEQRGPFVLAKRGADPKNNRVLWRRVGLPMPKKKSQTKPGER